MMTRVSSLFLAMLCSFSVLMAQEELNWKKHKKLADKLFEATQYVDAAAHYEDAWQQQPKELELIYKAGEAYFLIKDFKKTIHTLQHVKAENKRFPLVGLKYARALKQDGQYELAKAEFIYFISAYQGNDKAIIGSIVANEIKGCEKGLALAKSKVPITIQVEHLSENINSPSIEFGPIPYSDDLLYYSSTMKGNQAYLFRTQRKNGTWQKSVLAEGLPAFPNKHFANGSFAPDAKRFYFTLCDNGDGLNSKCEIYVLKREQSKWSEAIRLRDYINIADASTTTQPWIVHQNGQEILYFASDRTGGFGKMDIWYSTRNITSDDIDFTYPVNAGEKINTIGDEITPFYDLTTTTLYYSSNGKVTLGGWDIFQAKGALDQWATVENLGVPINSSADDFYYVLRPSGKGGFLASNRLYGAEKISTQHEDIFEFGTIEKTNKFYALGQVVDSETRSPIKGVSISLYEINGSNAKLLSSKKMTQPNYHFQILPDKKLRLVAEKKDYLKNVYDFDSYNAKEIIEYTHIFSLNKKATNQTIAANNKSSKAKQPTAPNYTTATASINEDVVDISPKKALVNSSPIRKQFSTPTATASVRVSVQKTTTLPKPIVELNTTGTYYKVQVVAVNYHDINHPRYAQVKNIGRIETEKVPKIGVTRVLIADLSNEEAAEKVKQQVVQYGFADAFVVKYKDGQRVGRVW